jgi:diacylglycerol kinase family enzyme
MDEPSAISNFASQPTLARELREVAIVANPYSGALENPRRVEALCSALRDQGLEPHTVWQLDELAALAATPDFKQRYRAVVAAGGDGTLSCVINAQTKAPVAIFPLGNENLFAKCFGHSSDPLAMARLIAVGRTKTIDLGKCGDRLFSIVASAGFDGDVVHRLAKWRRQDNQLRRVRDLSYLQPMAASVFGYRFPMLEIEADRQKLRGALAMVFNIPRYAKRLKLVPDAISDDGLLDWVVFEHPGIIPLARYAVGVLLEQHFRYGDVHTGRAQQIRLNCDTPVPIEVDGEAVGFAPTDITVVPSALDVIVP